ncbi:MAG: 30S ribosome-binding factor RbfA [Myxococcales bacterium]|nr:30S ribosome-binding factor RbfA [Myxococcales bacterium]
MSEVKRTDRVASAAQQVLAELLLREVRDPRLVFVSVTEVRPTADLSLLRVMVRRSIDDGAVTPKTILEALERCSGFLRREVGQRLKLRHAPALAFHYDEAPEKRGRIDALLAEIANDPKAQDEGEGEGKP